MKKLFLSVLAIASLVACNKEDLIQTQDPSKIAFGDSFVENVTRTTTADLDAFNVWGFMDKTTGTVFIKEDVTKVDGAWSYVNTQYWMPGHNYYFAAIAPMNSQNWDVNVDNANTDGLGVISFENVDGSEDLIYAATSVTTSADINEQPAPIKFQFNHLLSKVKFTFVNGFKTNNVSLKVKNVKMSAPASADLAVNTADWWVGDKWDNYSGNVDLDFADEVSVAAEKSAATAECLTIPASADQKYTVKFDIEIYYGDVLAKTSTKTATIEGVALQMGKAYNFTTTLDHTNATNDVLYPITFGEPQVLDWNNVEESFVTPIPVATAAELVEAVAAGNNVMLTADINLDAPAATAMSGTRAAADYGLIIGKDIVLDGNGYSITSAAVRAINVAAGAKNVTIKNVEVINTCPSGYPRAINVEANDAIINIENVTTSVSHYAVNLVGSSDNCKVNIKNSVLEGIPAVNVWGENTTVTVENTKLICNRVSDDPKETYAAIIINDDGSTAAINSVVNVIDGEIDAVATNFGASVAAEGAKVNFNGTVGNLTIEQNPYVIRYAETHYSFSTFDEAQETAKPGETIYLTNDVEFTANEMHVAEGKNVVVDLNGKTVAVKSLDPIKNLGTMTLKNGKIVADNSENTRRCVYNYGTMTIENVEFVQTYGKKGAAINNEGKMTIESATVNAVFYSIWASGSKSETIIKGGNYTTTNDITDRDIWAYAVKAQNGAKLVVNGGTITGNHGTIAAESGAEATLNAGKFVCTATYTGNSDWVLYGDMQETTPSGCVKYNQANCVLETANPNGAIYSAHIGKTVIAF